jgi:hypothetical protein
VDNVFDGFYRLIADRAFYLPQGVWDVINVAGGITHDVFLTRHTTGITDNGKLPAVHSMAAHPNPFNAATTLRFTILPPANLRSILSISMAEQLLPLYSGTANAGEYIAVWHPADLPSGVYFAKLSSADGTITTRLLLTK